jgi:uncharacterized protein
MKVFLRFVASVLGLPALFGSGTGMSNAQAKPPIPIIITIDPDRPVIERKVVAETAYQKGHDALAAGLDTLAIEQFELSCEVLNFKSCFNVGLLVEGQMHRSLSNRPQSTVDTRAVARITFAFRESCYGGFQRGCAALVQYYRTSKYGIQNLPAAIEFATTACDARETAACEDLAEMLYLGEGMAVNPPRAAFLFKQSCDSGGRALSCFNYGLMNDKGQGLVANAAIALEYYRTGCRRGSDLACINLATLYHSKSTDRSDRQIASALLDKSCGNGAMIACSNLAVLTEENDPSPADKARAAALYRKACEGGDGGACRGLGNLAQEGVKEAGPPWKAIQYFVKGCQLNSGKSCYNAGLMYNIGFHAPRRPSTALAWFAKGCALGAASSCAGAVLAAVAMKPGEPNGGEEVAKKWLDHALRLDPNDGVVKSMKDWMNRGASKADAPKLRE